METIIELIPDDDSDIIPTKHLSSLFKMLMEIYNETKTFPSKGDSLSLWDDDDVVEYSITQRGFFISSRGKYVIYFYITK